MRAKNTLLQLSKLFFLVMWSLLRAADVVVSPPSDPASSVVKRSPTSAFQPVIPKETVRPSTVVDPTGYDSGDEGVASGTESESSSESSTPASTRPASPVVVEPSGPGSSSSTVPVVIPASSSDTSPIVVTQPDSSSSVFPDEPLTAAQEAALKNTNNPSLLQKITGTTSTVAAADVFTPHQQDLFNLFLVSFENDPNFQLASAHVAYTDGADLLMVQKLFNAAKDLAAFKVKAMSGLCEGQQQLINDALTNSFSQDLTSGSVLPQYKAAITALVQAEGILSQATGEVFIQRVSAAPLTWKAIDAEVGAIRLEDYHHRLTFASAWNAPNVTVNGDGMAQPLADLSEELFPQTTDTLSLAEYQKKFIFTDQSTSQADCTKTLTSALGQNEKYIVTQIVTAQQPPVGETIAQYAARLEEVIESLLTIETAVYQAFTAAGGKRGAVLAEAVQKLLDPQSEWNDDSTTVMQQIFTFMCQNQDNAQVQQVLQNAAGTQSSAGPILLLSADDLAAQRAVTDSEITDADKQAIIKAVNEPGFFAWLFGKTTFSSADAITFTRDQTALFKSFLTKCKQDPNYKLSLADLDTITMPSQLAMAEKLFNTAQQLAAFERKSMSGLTVQEKQLVTTSLADPVYQSLLQSPMGIQTYQETVIKAVKAESIVKQALKNLLAAKPPVSVTQAVVNSEVWSIRYKAVDSGDGNFPSLNTDGIAPLCTAMVGQIFSNGPVIFNSDDYKKYFSAS